MRRVFLSSRAPVVEILGDLGVGSDAIEKMLRENPARFLAFEAPETQVPSPHPAGET